ncbi:MAG: hypothetical protein ACRD0A_16610 [Acidimicrobiales bacterium]
MLTSDEVSAILRRAAEIENERDTADGLAPGQIDLAAVEQAAGEVGISVEAVRQAYAELQVGGLPAEPDGSSSRPAVIGPAKVAEQRVVRLPPDEVRERIGRMLHKQTFELRRSSANASLWRRRDDFGASVRRGFDFNKNIKLADARAITVQLTEVADRDRRPATLVRLEADIGQIKAGTAAATVAVPTGLAVAAGGIGALVGEPAVMVLAAGAWLPVTAGSVGLGRFLYRKEYLKVGELLGMFLDRLEG